VANNWLYGLNKAFSNVKTAAVQPKMLSDENPNHFEYAGAADGFIDKYGYPFCRGRIFEDMEMDNGQYDNQPNLFWASGAALAIRKDVFVETGGFDEDFEFHMEEIDLCWRLQNSGYNIGYAPGSVVYHLGGGSLPMGSPRKVFYNFRNSLFMLWKNYSSSSLRKRFIIRLMLDIIAALKALVSGKHKDFWAVLKAHIHFYRNFPSVNKKRILLQQKRMKESDPETMINMSLIWQYFIRGTKTFQQLKEKAN
jgi:GT2 family glycosyltransferase